MQSKTRGSSPEKTIIDSKMIIVGANRDRNLYVATRNNKTIRIAEQLIQQGISWILTGPAANFFGVRQRMLGGY